MLPGGLDEKGKPEKFYTSGWVTQQEVNFIT
jgi:hypothetical protein